jgi:lactoylglutathione lyase
MNKSTHLLSLPTLIYGVTDVARAKEWYTQVLGFPPYFDQPYYVGFQVNGLELGLDPNAKPVGNKHKGVIGYWQVADIDAEYTRILDLGGVDTEKPHDVGDGIKVAQIADPFGNIIGLIFNPHLK